MFYRCLQSILRFPDWDLEINVDSGVVIDYFVSAMWWAATVSKFSPEQLSAFFTLVFNLHNSINGPIISFIKVLKFVKLVMFCFKRCAATPEMDTKE